MPRTPRALVESIKQNVARVIVGKDGVTELMLIALICRGHVLLEDVPGVGKTMLASALARSLQLSFGRIQFTPDVMPSDVTGYTMVNVQTGASEFRQGAVMKQIVLADEINRTSPKTQSALLEVMEEGRVTVDGKTYELAKPFIVLATQNPVEFVGTYPLPEAQLDRFFMRVRIGYPSPEEEADVLARYTTNTAPLDTLAPVCAEHDILALQGMVSSVYCSQNIRDYVVALAGATRAHASLTLGASTRACIGLMRAAQACALLSGRDYAMPDDVRRMAEPVWAHRLTLAPDARIGGFTGERVIAEVLARVPVRAS